ncbi:MAG: 50S ribosomal protein L2 [Bacteroidetes bacterium]|nr:50S ribosomal protein L2 [Bacteroidota bacterium]
MGLRKFKSMTPGTRWKIISDFDEITAAQPEKSLMAPYKSTGGRNNSGKMTMRYLGGGHKRRFRIIDFRRDKFNIPGIVKTVEYDPNRSGRIALVQYPDGEKRYILAPQGIKVGQTVMSGDKAVPENGNALYLKNIPMGTFIYNIELHAGKGGQLVRSGGSMAQIIAREGNYAVIKLPSGETRKVLSTCMATIGLVSNPENNLVRHGKAGRKRWLGIRPRNRGVAMNPVDHPMGGGEGKASGGHPRSRKGFKAIGKKTRSDKKYSNKYILERRTKGYGMKDV